MSAAGEAQARRARRRAIAPRSTDDAAAAYRYKEAEG